MKKDIKTKFAVFIPTYNAGADWEKVLAGVKMQKLRPHTLAVIDSASKDRTVEIAKAYGAEVISIAQKDFTHGLARHRLTEAFPDNDIFIFMTQDAVPGNEESFTAIISAFDDPEVGVAYGRQLPRQQAGLLERHERQFNYPARSVTRSLADIPELGFKTIFCSNSFAAYRRSAYLACGGFPRNALFGEDTLLTARMIDAHWKIAYVAEATVIHSHGYTFDEERSRYQEIGKFHHSNPWLYERFGKPAKEGLKFLFSQLRFVAKNDVLKLPEVVLRVANKWLAYKQGYKKGG